MKPGTYKAVVTDHHWTTSASNNPGLAIQVDIPDDFGGVESMTGTIWFTPKSMSMARGQLKALGFNPDRQHARDIGSSISLRDREVAVVVAEEEYKGRKSLKISRFGVAASPPSSEQLAGLDELLAAAKKADEKEEAEAPHDESLSGNLPMPPPTPAPTEETLPF